MFDRRVVTMANNITIVSKDKQKAGSEYTIVSVRMRESLLDQLDTISAQTNRSRNEIINLLLESAVDMVEVQ